MTLNDDELRQQLERRTKSAPLEQPDRAGLVDSIHVAASMPRQASRRWLPWLGVPAAAGFIAVALLFAVSLPRTPQAAATFTPGRTTTPPPSSATTIPPSLVGASGLDVLSADELVALAAALSKVGQLVVSSAEISFEPNPTQFDVPGGLQEIGTIEASTGSVIVMGESWPDTEWTDHAFRVMDGGRLEYLGAVNYGSGNGLWTVQEATAAAPPEAASLLLAVQGWLMQTVPAPCAAPMNVAAGQDYWCGGSWITSEPVLTGDNGSVQLTIPGGIHVQWDAYSNFAPDPKLQMGGESRLGIYLVRPNGCPPNVMGDCPVWEMVGRLDPTTVAAALTPNPDSTPSPQPSQQPQVDCLGGLEPATCDNYLPVALAAVSSSGWSPVHVWISSGQLCPLEDCLFDPTANFPAPVPPDGGRAIGSAEIAFAETDKHAGMQLSTVDDQVEAALIGYAVPPLDWCSGECPTSSTTDGPFRFEFVLPHLDWHSSDSISGTAILSFAGDGSADISGSGHPIGFSYVEVNGDRSVYPVFSADCATHRLDTATPMTQVLSKSGVLQTDFQSSFVPGPDIKLPVGSWDISATVGFFDGLGCSGEPHEMTAALRISVTH